MGVQEKLRRTNTLAVLNASMAEAETWEAVEVPGAVIVILDHEAYTAPAIQTEPPAKEPAKRASKAGA